MRNLLSIIIIFLFSLFPILLWGYGVTFLSKHIWNRARFFTGMFSGGLTVIIISILNQPFLANEYNKIGALFVLFFTLFGGVWIATANGSDYVRTFLRKITAIHIGIILFCFLLFEYIDFFVHPDVFMPVLMASFSGILFASGIEESAKHLSAVGLTAREFRFSRQDFIIFSLFVTLGFIFVENIIYLYHVIPQGPWNVFYLGFMRIFFSFLAHFLAASICVVTWWKALSYGLFSWKYITIFLLGYLGAIFSHALFNYMLDAGFLLGIAIFAFVSYIACTQWLIGESDD